MTARGTARWAKAAVALACVSIVALSSECSIGDVDLHGHACPCVDDTWTCVSGVCVATGANPGDAEAPEDAGDGGAPGSFTVANLRAEWTTAHNIRWQWDVTGSASDFFAYEVDVVGPDGSTLVEDRSQYPELGEYAVQNPSSGAMELVHEHTSLGLAASTAYLAYLVAYDSQNRPFRIGPAGASTTLWPDPSLGGRAPLLLFQGATPPNAYALPSGPEYSIDAGCGVEAGPCLVYQPRLDPEVFPQDGGASDAAYVAFQNLRRQGFSPSVLPAGGTSTTFGDFAYLEFDIATDVPIAADWCEVWLVVGPPEGGSCAQSSDACRFTYNAWALPIASSYRHLEVPLRVMQQGGVTMTPGDFASGITGFNVAGATWKPFGSVRVDNVRVRY